MSVGDKAKAAAKNVKGNVKEGAGRASGNERLTAEGKADKAAGAAQHKAAKAKETVKQTGKGTAGKVKETTGKTVGNETLTLKGKAQQAAAKTKKKVNK